LTALVGAVGRGPACHFLGNGLLAAVLGGIGWVIALDILYELGWPKVVAIASATGTARGQSVGGGLVTGLSAGHSRVTSGA
jgi:hypothetical protein